MLSCVAFNNIKHRASKYFQSQQYLPTKAITMKLAVLAVVFTLCLAFVAADIDYSIEDNEIAEFAPLGIADELGDADTFSVFGILWFAITGSLRTLKGVNCTVRRVMSIRSEAVNFLNAFKGCNSGALKDLNALINQVQTVVNTCNDIINLNSNVCNNGALDDQADAKKNTSFSCFFKLLGKMLSLKNQVGKTITLSKKLSSTPGTYGTCNMSAVTDLVSVFTQFPTYVKTCSKLRS
ncbi:uncharacterized protein LOC105211128 [Zeugodacus cucurbitae]|uniref:Transcription initiation factor TFIID subunit 2 n=1 Tax=Zeugodacus cucurbitae TaxID=28588 RepID=A0A0A1X729_ZEUCU|nr:uncharacterized protein LOC105211128 [Zeugodacus cucurbitae]